MSSPTLAVPSNTRESVLGDFGSHEAEPPTVRSSAIRGAITGMVLGAGAWALIITALVKLFKS